MKTKIATLLISFLCALGIVLPSVASADWYGGRYYRSGYYHGGYHRGGYYRGYGYTKCRWVGGFWRNGYWHPSRRVCWRVR